MSIRHETRLMVHLDSQGEVLNLNLAVAERRGPGVQLAILILDVH